MNPILFSLLLLSLCPLAAEDYDPLSKEGKVETKLMSFRYGGREVPLKIYLPEDSNPAPVILLSHGLGGSREVGNYLGQHWAGRGFLVVAMQHIGSDTSVWEDAPLGKRRDAMMTAANGRTFQDRMRDVPATLDQLEKWQIEKGHVLSGRMNLERIGVGGHSYGAVTTQAIAGQRFGPLGARYADERIDAALALSPSAPRMGSAEAAFSGIKMPMMLMTGTKDGSPIGRTAPASRREVYPALPKGNKFELVLKDAEHHAFSDARDGGESDNPNHHRVIQALSTAFWESFLRGEQEAMEWLQGDGPEALMEKGDLWQKK
ncbi:alpha/beta hydrolase family protein [Roseibacillus persicicus]|uniref:Dienelactone hydrolase n=1 Tax=Roseibacillus persicicus TaxID=454148 RepID=A0A918TDM7_9BACT|nr:dienelactone hydrolase [Roseibacillus persicicus]GHC39843.1 hypothetical protein GCM10007100_00100 [Roseibacillus persicicus]